MSMDQRLAAMRDIVGRPRFYPPGQHPAATQWRQCLEKMRLAGVSDDHEYVRYIKDRLAMFEEGESEAKQLYLLLAPDAEQETG